jgi:hypothetical protein
VRRVAAALAAGGGGGAGLLPRDVVALLGGVAVHVALGGGGDAGAGGGGGEQRRRGTLLVRLEATATAGRERARLPTAAWPQGENLVMETSPQREPRTAAAAAVGCRPGRSVAAARV